MASLAETLEQCVDSHGVHQVLITLANVCADKADHICSNWQDRLTAKPWAAASIAIENAANKIKV